jgi:hypothetical protein
LTEEAILIAEINHAVAVDHAWTGHEHPAVYEMFADVRPDSPVSGQPDCALDVVVIVRGSVGPTEIHGIVILHEPTPKDLGGHLTTAMQSAEYTWVAARRLPEGNAIPPEIGLLTYTGLIPSAPPPPPYGVPAWRAIDVRRRATLQPAPNQTSLLKGLLVRAMRGRLTPLPE